MSIPQGRVNRYTHSRAWCGCPPLHPCSWAAQQIVALWAACLCLAVHASFPPPSHSTCYLLHLPHSWPSPCNDPCSRHEPRLSLAQCNLLLCLPSNKWQQFTDNCYNKHFSIYTHIQYLENTVTYWQVWENTISLTYRLKFLNFVSSKSLIMPGIY